MSELVMVDEQPKMPATVNESAAIITVIERAAMNPNVDIDKMERLLMMQERIIAKNAEQVFNAALAEMQDELPVILESGAIKNSSGKVQSTYAKWEDINEAIKPILRKHGFALTFKSEINGSVKVTGILTHKAGHREQTEIVLPADTSGSKNAVQAVASSVSYGQRYTAKLLLNFTSRGEDDDGQSAGQQKAKEPMKATCINGAQIADLRNALKVAGCDEAEFLKAAKVESINAITVDRFQGGKEWIQKRAQANANN